MNKHDQYMADFMKVYQPLARWGPGNDADSLKALSSLPITPRNILDIGCGKGFSTQLLAQHTDAHIVAVDNQQSALDELGKRLAERQLDARITLSCASMMALPFSPASFDCIWSEGSAYIMGIEQALVKWRPLLERHGCMVISDLVWLTNNPSAAAIKFWQQEYADLQTVATRLTQMQVAGFEVVDHFTLSEQAGLDYYSPLKARVLELKPSMTDSAAIGDLEREIAIFEHHPGEFAYHMFVLQKGA
ncbi:class I SAM-dependent methyltransferase [Arenicella chitinivorans]|nr:class I SAM-dependent methyltransferase [Arenicella chitinivorans]